MTRSTGIATLFRTLATMAGCMAATLAVAQQDAPCVPFPGSDALWENDGVRFILVGEVHGTNESPTVFADLVCAAAQDGRHLLVALEHPEQDSGKFETYLASAGTETDRRLFLEDNTWARNPGDGRTSVAMWEMIERLRQFRAAGMNIDITTFIRVPTERGDSQTPYEQALAASLLDAAEAVQPDLVLVTVGSVHASKARFDGIGVPAFEPMAMHLPPDATLSLMMLHEGGEAWNCTAPDDCAIHPSPPRRANGNAAIQSTSGLVLGSDLRAGFDGVIGIGKVTASPPYRGD